MHGRRGSGCARGCDTKPAVRRWAACTAGLGGLACMTAAGGALAQKWQLSASAGATATYNHYSGANQGQDGLVACLTGSLGIRSGEGAPELNGSWALTTSHGRPGQQLAQRRLAANPEVIEKFFCRRYRQRLDELATWSAACEPDGRRITAMFRSPIASARTSKV
jgi:hypothetical protein